MEGPQGRFGALVSSPLPGQHSSPGVFTQEDDFFPTLQSLSSSGVSSFPCRTTSLPMLPGRTLLPQSCYPKGRELGLALSPLYSCLLTNLPLWSLRSPPHTFFPGKRVLFPFHFQPLTWSPTSLHHFRRPRPPAVTVQAVHCTRASG